MRPAGSPWCPCFLDWEQYTRSFLGPTIEIDDPGLTWTEELCPLCSFSHLTVGCYRIVSAWLRLQPDHVREVALSLGHYWEGTWLELQVAAVKLATE